MKLDDFEERRIQKLYESAKHNRQSMKDKKSTSSKDDPYFIELEYFWSGSISAIHSICEILNLKPNWLRSREEDFNQYYRS
jgi:hypothetical protein